MKPDLSNFASGFKLDSSKPLGNQIQKLPGERQQVAVAWRQRLLKLVQEIVDAQSKILKILEEACLFLNLQNNNKSRNLEFTTAFTRYGGSHSPFRADQTTVPSMRWIHGKAIPRFGSRFSVAHTDYSQEIGVTVQLNIWLESIVRLTLEDLEAWCPREELRVCMQ